MELTDDLVAIQGILISAIKTTGEFTKINHKGGNEEKILKIIGDIQKHILSKNYLKDGKVNKIFDPQLQDIVLFLAINTKYKNPLQLEDYEHLIGIMPQLSKCILANIVYGLDLCKYYCKAIEKLPLAFGVELFEEIAPCLKKCQPESQLRYAIMLLRTAVIKLSSPEISDKDEDDMYHLLEVTNIILMYLTGVQPNHVKNVKAAQIYVHMGYTLLSLLELLLFCNKEEDHLKKFIENVIKTCCSLVMNVTINVFCAWAEVVHEDDPLQSVVAGKAFEVVEKYQKYKEAKELISMLGTIAKKPKTLSERIHSADVDTIIQKVYVKDQDQKAWFQALLARKILDNDSALRCVRTWAHLCDMSDVSRLLKLCHQSKQESAKLIALKCASTLSLEDLLVTMTRYFYEHKFIDLLPDSECDLKLIFNKIHANTEIDEDFIKSLCLLILQHPSTFLNNIYGECLREKSFTRCYAPFFAAIKDIVVIHNFGVDSLWRVISNNNPETNNIDNYVVLFSTLIETGHLTSSEVIKKFLLPLLDRCKREKEYGQLGCVLQIFLGCSLKVTATSDMTSVRWSLLDVTSECRCTFLELDPAKQQACSYAVEIIRNLCELCPTFDLENESQASANTANSYDEFAKYYVKYLSSKTETTLLRTLYSDFNIDNYGQCVSMVLRFLPRAVISEWMSIIEEVFFLCSGEKAAELLTDVMILLCQVVYTQDPSTNTGKQVIIALKYCLQQYGAALQKMQVDSSIELEKHISRSVCRLLKYVPETIQEEEGLSLVNILTERSLKALNSDNEFVCLCISIDNDLICRTIQNRMMTAVAVL